MSRDIAIVGFAQSEREQPEGQTETVTLIPVVTAALEQAGLVRSEIGFTCSGSSDYLTGGVFTFVQTLEVAGAWPPISESHVEMDGAWALYEAWVRLLHGDVDTALVYASSKPSAMNLDDVLALQLDPYYLSPLRPDRIALAALQAQAVLDATGRSESDLAGIVARSLRDAGNNPYAEVSGDHETEELLRAPYVSQPLRAHDCPPASAGAVAVVLAAGDAARRLSDRPAWIRGIDHRVDSHYPGMRDLSVSPSTCKAGEKAGAGNAPIEVAELTVNHPHEELILREALGLDDHVVINPSGGPLGLNPIMATGLLRIGEAFRQISEQDRNRVLAHASTGPCLQQNLVCVLEAD